MLPILTPGLNTIPLGLGFVFGIWPGLYPQFSSVIGIKKLHEVHVHMGCGIRQWFAKKMHFIFIPVDTIGLGFGKFFFIKTGMGDEADGHQPQDGIHQQVK